MAKIKYTNADEFDLDCRMSLDEFKQCCEFGAIISSDGIGYYGTKDQVTDIPANPYAFIKGKNLTKFEYVYWYNK